MARMVAIFPSNPHFLPDRFVSIHEIVFMVRVSRPQRLRRAEGS